jgi:Asp-tRNA(Asn)/Glu-tRNA(Gln) amidotransferase A subunit family amidase
MADALSLPIAEIAVLLGEGKLKARALAEEAIANHERFGPKLVAYSQWAPEHARKCADAADAAFAVGSRAGSLQGIPTSIKDLFAVAGFPTYAGTPRRLPPKFEIDGPVVANLRRQLATVMGKTHMVEFAFGGTGQNAHYGSPRNPWDATAHRSPGGSSSGAGVSLCEGSALLAFGTDTAASVRLPASMTGNAGLKLTKDRWSTEGIVPLSFTLDTPGILARSMADAGFSFAALDPDLGDGFAFLRGVPSSVDGIRIGIADPWFWDACENGIGEIVRLAIDSLARAGAVVTEAPLPEARDAFAIYVEFGDRVACFPRSRIAGLACDDRSGQRARAQECREPVGTRISDPSPAAARSSEKRRRAFRPCGRDRCADSHVHAARPDRRGERGAILGAQSQHRAQSGSCELFGAVRGYAACGSRSPRYACRLAVHCQGRR